MSERIDQLKEEEKAAMAGSAATVEGNTAAMERQSACAEEGEHGWILGLVLVGLGVLFLLNNVFDIALIDNWWALFILIPAGGKLSHAWRSYQAAGRWTGEASSALIGGLVIGAVAFMFLFNLSWGLFWPVLLILFGAGLLLRTA